MSHVSQLTRFSSTGFAGCARPSAHGTLRECGFRTDELGGRAEFQSARQTQARRAAENTLQNIWHGGIGSGAEWHGKLCSALGLHSWWTRSRPPKSAHSCTARPPLLPSLNLCCVCAACDRRRLLLLLWSQDRRESTARRCSSLLYIGLHHAQQLAALGAVAYERAAWITLECCGTAMGTTFSAWVAGARDLKAYCDANWSVTRSTTGFFIMLAGAAISCVSRRQHCITMSTCEAELVALADCAIELLHIIAVVSFLGHEIVDPVDVFTDSKAATTYAIASPRRRTLVTSIASCSKCASCVVHASSTCATSPVSRILPTSSPRSCRGSSLTSTGNSS